MHTPDTTPTRCIRVRLPDDDYRQLGHQAVEARTSLGALIREAVRRFLENAEPEVQTESTT
jgi:hypothetical protein